MALLVKLPRKMALVDLAKIVGLQHNLPSVLAGNLCLVVI